MSTATLCLELLVLPEAKNNTRDAIPGEVLSVFLGYHLNLSPCIINLTGPLSPYCSPVVS